MSTVAAISTPQAEGGISVIRISGEDAFKIADSIFVPLSDKKKVSEMKGYTCCYGKIVYKNTELDDVVVTVFKAPKSYTGEDVCEISCHGGIYVTRQILSAVIDSGAEPACAGEFTKRAFLNGKMSLTQAEAVMDIISAQGRQAHAAAVSEHDGALFTKIRNITGTLIALLGELAAWVDYPEEDLPAIEHGTFENTLKDIISQLEALLNSYDSGRIIRNGIDTVICGKPNVGKSTLMNMLAGTERSIVTDIAGTTRDIVEETVRVGDLVLRLSDTAGIRNTTDIVEGVGVDRAYKKLQTADLVIAVFDNSRELSDDDMSIIEKLNDRPCIAVINKSDLNSQIDKEKLKQSFKYIVEISAKQNDGFNELALVLEKIFKLSCFDTKAGIIANERQKKCVTHAYESIKAALSDLTIGETYDAVTVLLNDAADALLELTGERATEAVVNEVFSKFCVGK